MAQAKKIYTIAQKRKPATENQMKSSIQNNG